jgi:PEP-CTERM motif
MTHRRSFLLSTAALAGAVLLGTASPARATLQLRISTDNGATFSTMITDNGPGDTNPAVGGIGATFALPGGGNVMFTVSSNQPIPVNFSQIRQVELAMAGSTDVSFPGQTFIIDVTDTNFNRPSGLSTLTSETSSTGFQGTHPSQASVTFQSWADNNNIAFGGTPQNPSAGAFTPGPQVEPSNTNFGGPNPPDTVSINSLATPPLSLTNRFTVSNVFIPAGGSLQLTGTATLAAVPEPATLVSALIGLPMLGAFWRRRRAATSA